jgi:hypothetical protein
MNAAAGSSNHAPSIRAEQKTRSVTDADQRSEFIGPLLGKDPPICGIEIQRQKALVNDR